MIRHKARLIVMLAACALDAPCFAQNAPADAAAALAGFPASRDYGLMWWPEGWQTGEWSVEDRVPRKLVRCVRTGHYAMAMDAGSMTILHLGPIEKAKSYLQAAAEDDEAVSSLPAARLLVEITVQGKRYRCVRGAHPRLVDAGRFVQRGDIVGLSFESENGESLPANARLEVTCWPETLSFQLEAGPASPADGKTKSSGQPDAPAIAESWNEMTLAIELGYAGRTFRASSSLEAGAILKAGDRRSISLTIHPARPEEAVAEPAGLKISASDPASGAPVRSLWIADNACYQIDMNRAVAPDARNDYFDSAALRVENTTDRWIAAPLWFHQEPCRNPVGVSPLLRELDGTPTGIPVQISKDWHNLPDGAPYDKSWLHAYSLLRVPPRTTINYRLDIAHAYWGTMPAASHAQLSLLGWDRRADQQWDQVAIGSWGESICYDPEINLNRSFIDDMRPLFVSGTAGTQWGWTNNVGGGEFLYIQQPKGHVTRLQRMKTAYLLYCPIATEAIYHGITADKAISGHYTVCTMRANDFPRHFHKLRYDVRSPVKSDHLAFYQLGAPKYNENHFGKMARGNASAGLIEEWQITRASGKLDRSSMAAEGPDPWFSLHGVDPAQGSSGIGCAARGLVVRAWKARLGGKEMPSPFFSVFGAPPSAILELTTPPGVTELLPGDFVEAMLEIVVLPVAAADYYGPDPAFKAVLAEGANSWKPVLAEARVGSRLKVDVSIGELKRPFPLVVQVKDNRAEFSITGSIGYSPVIFTGLSGYRNPTLEVRDISGSWKKVDQSNKGNDFWQTDYNPDNRSWMILYTIPPDMLPPDRARHDLRFQVETARGRTDHLLGDSTSLDR